LANIGESIQKTNKKSKKVSFLLKKTAYKALFMPKQQDF